MRWGQAADSIEAATSSMVSRLDPAMLPKRVLAGRVQVVDGGVMPRGMVLERMLKAYSARVDARSAVVIGEAGWITDNR